MEHSEKLLLQKTTNEVILNAMIDMPKVTDRVVMRIELRLMGLAIKLTCEFSAKRRWRVSDLKIFDINDVGVWS